MIDIDEMRARNIHAGLDCADYVGYFEVGTLRALLDELEALRALEGKVAEITVHAISDSHKVERIYELIARRNSN